MIHSSSHSTTVFHILVIRYCKGNLKAKISIQIILTEQFDSSYLNTVKVKQYRLIPHPYTTVTSKEDLPILTNL